VYDHSFVTILEPPYSCLSYHFVISTCVVILSVLHECFVSTVRQTLTVTIPVYSPFNVTFANEVGSSIPSLCCSVIRFPTVSFTQSPLHANSSPVHYVSIRQVGWGVMLGMPSFRPPLESLYNRNPTGSNCRQGTAFQPATTITCQLPTNQIWIQLRLPL